MTIDDKEFAENLIRSFIAKASGITEDDLDAYSVIVVSKSKGTKHLYGGGELRIYGALDLVKRGMFVEMMDRAEMERGKKSVTIGDIRRIIREELDSRKGDNEL